MPKPPVEFKYREEGSSYGLHNDIMYNIIILENSSPLTFLMTSIVDQRYKLIIKGNSPNT